MMPECDVDIEALLLEEHAKQQHAARPIPIAPKPTPIPGTGPVSLENLIATFRRWLDLPDPGALVVALGAVAANRSEGDPVWVLLVGPPGSGKTEILASLSGLPNVHQAATLTEPALLSGSPKREQTTASTGGLLRTIGQSGLLVCKDFGSVLSMRHDDRAGLLAALREIYDGSWTRLLGTDGGRSLSWTGKVGLLGGCTQVIDLHHAVMASLGERFLLYRLDQVDPADLAGAALKSIGKESAMRRELVAAVNGFFSGNAKSPSELSEDDKRWLVALSTLVSRCRSAVERDGYSRDIELIPGAEMPGRLVRCLAQLLGGLAAIGVEWAERRALIRKTALDSIPATRRRVIEVLSQVTAKIDTRAVAKELGYPTVTARRALEDLTAHGVLECESMGQGTASRWGLSYWTQKRWAEIQ